MNTKESFSEDSSYFKVRGSLERNLFRGVLSKEQIPEEEREIT